MIAPLARHMIESTVFAAAVFIVLLCLWNRGATVRHAVLLTGAVKFAVPAALFLMLGIRLGSLLPERYSSVVGSTPLPDPIPEVLTMPPSSTAAVVLAVWLSGIVIMFAVWLGRTLAYRRGFDQPANPGGELLDEIRRRLRIRTAVRLRDSAYGSELGLSGIWRPVINVPQGLASQLTPVEFEAVLLHEMAHVRRWDNLWGALVHALVCLFWFHPLLWWIERRLLIERERACDEIVIQSGTEAETYAAGILKVCRMQLDQGIAGTSAIGGSDLKTRMEIIMSYRQRSPIPHAPRLLLGTLAFVMTIVPLLGGMQSALNAQSAPGGKAACVWASVEYPEQTVLQMGTHPGASKKICANGAWAPTVKPVTVVATAPPPIPTTRDEARSVCQPKPSTSSNECTCQSGNFSIGAIVNTPNGKMRCDKFVLGKYTTWRPATPTDLGTK